MKTVLRILGIAIMLALLAFLVPSTTPMAIGEETLPAYQPIVLEGAEIAPVDWSVGTPFLPHDDAFAEDGLGYSDPSISVRVESTTAYNTVIQLTWVQIADASQIRSELAKPYPSQATARGDVMSRRVNAVLAMNGDYFVHRKEGYVVRNGQLLRPSYSELYDNLIIDDKGDLHIIQSPTQEKLDSFDGVMMQVYAFGPGLVIDGVKTEDEVLKLQRECAPERRTQRIALCQMDPLSYLIIATEGPENPPLKKQGLTLFEMAQLCADLGVKQAYNMDGGGSSTVVLGGKKINALSTKKNRAIGDILYFVTAVPAEGTAEGGQT